MRSRHKVWLLTAAALAAAATASCGESGTDAAGPGAPPAAPPAAPPVASEPAVNLPVRSAPPRSEILDLELARDVPLAMAPYLTRPEPEIRRIAVRALGRTMRASAAQEIAPALRDPDPGVREAACFAIGLTGAAEAAGLLGPAVGPEAKPSAAEVAAAIQGLANCADESASHLLVRLATREDLPVEGPEAIFRHFRARTMAKMGPWTPGLPDTKLLAFEKHASPRGRAGIGTLGRVWKDPVLLDPLERLASDPEPEVRRTAALGLGEGRPGATRPPADALRALTVLEKLLRDPDWRVVVCALRATSSYDAPVVVERLSHGLSHASFHVRTAACEGLGAKSGKAAIGDLERLARTDPSASVRYAAAQAVLAIDEGRAQALVPSLLGHDVPNVRAAAAEILAKSKDPIVVTKLISLSKDDRHALVRQAALAALEGKTTQEAEDAVQFALLSSDAGTVAAAAGVVAANGWKHMVRDMINAFRAHPGTKGADAREAVIGALATLEAQDGIAIIQDAAATDPDAGPRSAAIQAIADANKQPTGPPDRRPRPERAGGPLGAPLLDHDVDLVVETDQGTMRIRLDASEAPLHAAHLADLARKGFYDGLTWHRVVPDFVIQGGCPRGDGSGNGGVSLPIEPTLTPFERGTLGMPRSNHPDTGGCQLFICHSRAPHLDVSYSAIGRVVEGLDVIDRIDVGSKIVRVTVAEAK